MNDYLDILEKFKDVKDIIDLYNEVLLLREYHNARSYQKKMEKYKVPNEVVDFVEKNIQGRSEDNIVNFSA